MRAEDELTGVYSEPTAADRIAFAAALAVGSTLYAAFPVVLIYAEVRNALAGDFRSFGLCSTVSLVMLGAGVHTLWRSLVWEPPRRVRWFRFAGGVLEYETARHGRTTLPIGQVEGVYQRQAKGGAVIRWSVRRTDGEWLVVAGATANGQELIDRLCRDGGWREPAQSPV